MSLRVWLPLDGDLRNLGISNVTTISGTPIYKVGKIGANALNLNTRITFECSALANLQTFSVCFWGMAEDSSTLTTNWQDLLGFQDISAGGSAGTFRWETTYASTSGVHWHDNATNALVNGSHNHITVKNQWVHCCVVFDYEAGKIYSYDNGKLTQTHNHAGGHFNSSGRFYVGETNNIEGRITDVRFYDHALSAAEIHEISQGLILHYKLDDITNNIEDSSGYNHNGIYVDTTISNNSPRYSACISCIGTTVDNSSNTITGAQYFYCNMDMPTTNAITIAWWNKIMKYGRGGIFETSNSIQTNTTKGTDYNTTAFANWDSTFGIYNGSTRINIFSNFARNGEWHHHAITFDGVNVKYYLDGILKQTSALTGNLPAWKSFCIGLGKAGGVWRQIQQNVSDFRIYCTALQPNDIKALYNTPIKLDKQGNWFAHEYKELAQNTQFLKTGTIITGNIYDDLYYDKIGRVGKTTNSTLFLSDLNIITTKDSSIKTGTINSIPAATITSLAGKTLVFSYDVCTEGARYSDEQGQTAWNQTRYGIHGSMQYVNSSGTSGTNYPFASALEYKGPATHIVQTWQIPTNYNTYGNLSFSVQNYNKPASTNNNTWFIRNVKLEVRSDITTGYLSGTQLIEF